MFASFNEGTRGPGSAATLLLLSACCLQPTGSSGTGSSGGTSSGYVETLCVYSPETEWNGLAPTFCGTVGDCATSLAQRQGALGPDAPVLTGKGCDSLICSACVLADAPGIKQLLACEPKPYTPCEPTSYFSCFLDAGASAPLSADCTQAIQTIKQAWLTFEDAGNGPPDAGRDAG